MNPIVTTGLIIAAAIILFVWNRLPVIIVAMGVALALYATGVLTLNKALAGLGDPSVIFIASLFVISARRSGWRARLRGAARCTRPFSISTARASSS
jgi:hypothetical protein